MRNSHFLLRVLALVAVFGSAVALAQDRCFNAVAISAGQTIGNNGNATTGGDPTCPVPVGKDVWYSYVAPCNGNITVDTCGAATNFDTVLSVFDGNCGCNALVRLACNDQFCGNSSSVTFSAVQGSQYFISVAGYLSASGYFALTVSPCVPGVPTNDNCGGTFIPIGYRVVGHNFGATTAGLPAVCTSSQSNVWYSINSGQNGGVTVTTCNTVVGAGTTTFDTVLHVRANCLSGSSGCNDDSCLSTQSSVSFAVATGNNFYLSVGGYFGATGRFGLKATYVNKLDLNFWEQGPGTIGFRVSGDANYYYFFATANAGSYPSGWFYGIDISVADLYVQLGGGSPFNGPLTACGTNGPYGPLPSGFTVYAVALGTPTPGGYPTVISPPVSFTVP